MQEGKFDLCMVNKRFEYLLVYSKPDTPDTIDTEVYPVNSIKFHLESMKSKGYVIHNMFRRIEEQDLFAQLP